MASTVSASTFCCSTSLKTCKPFANYAVPSYSSCLQSDRNIHRFYLSKLSSQLAPCSFSSWNGLKLLGTPISLKPLAIGRKRCRKKGMVVRASLFGVGAPEALVIGVVALLVFGPKGLAEVARNLGKTLRAFQPTIRELQDVSREFKSSLEREIGLDEIPNPSQGAYGSNRPNIGSTPTSSSRENSQTVSDLNGSPSSKAYSSEEYLKITEEQLKAAASIQTASSSSPEENQNETTQAQETASETPPSSPNPESKA